MPVAIARPKNNTLSTIVARNSVFSTPLRLEKTPPISEPVNPPKPAPLLCKMTLKIKDIDTAIKAMFKKVSIPEIAPLN